MAKTLWRLSQVRQRIPYSRSQIYKLISIGEFPRPVPLGARAVAWDADEIEAWIAERIAARQTTGKRQSTKALMQLGGGPRVRRNAAGAGGRRTSASR